MLNLVWLDSAGYIFVVDCVRLSPFCLALWAAKVDKSL